MTPILYASDEIDFLNTGLGQLVELYDVDIQEQRNGVFTFTGSYPVVGERYSDIQEGRIILAKPSPLDDNHAFRIVNTQLDISGYAVQIEADSITYDLTHNIVKSVVMQGDGQTAMKTLQNAVLNPSIFTFYSDITATGFSELNFVNPMQAIAGIEGSFLQKWGGELKRENRRVAMFNRRGRDNVATFRLGKNISGLKYTVDTANLVTQIIPTVTITEGDASRYIEGTPVSSKRIGNYPVKYMQHVDLSDVVKVNDGDSDDTIRKNINSAAAGWFTQSENIGKDLPQVTVEVDVLSLQDSADYSDKFAKLETIGLTDTVTVYVPEYGVNVTAIVNELHYDPIGERVTSLVVGTAKMSFADANKSSLSDLMNKVTQVQEQASNAVVSANSKNSIHTGRTRPAHAQEGDTWFWEDGENSGTRVFENGDWVDVVDTQTQERITNEVKNAVDTATAYADKLNSTQAEATNSLADELAEKADELTKSQQNIADQATAYTDNLIKGVNQKVVDVTKTADGVYQAVYDSKTGLNTRVSTAEGNVEKIQSNVKDVSNTVVETVDGLTREISDRKSGDTNTLQSGKDFTTSQIKSYDTGMQSQLTLMSNEFAVKIGQLQGTNMLVNTEFSPDFLGWDNASAFGYGWGYNGSTSIVAKTELDMRQTFNLNGAKVLSASVWRKYVPDSGTKQGGRWSIMFYDAKDAFIKSFYGTYVSSKIDWTLDKIENITVPDNASYAKFRVYTDGTGKYELSKPMVVPEASVTEYVAGAYRMNNSTVLNLLKDNWNIGIADNIGLITNGIVGDSNSIDLISKNVTIDSPNTQIKGTAWITTAMIGDGQIGTAKIGDLAVTSAKISELDVNKLSGNITNFIKSYWSNAYQNLQIDANAIDFTTSNSRTKIENGSLTMWQNAGGYYRLGGIKALKSTAGDANNHTAGVYLALDEWQTTNKGDKYYDYGGQDFFGGSEIGIVHSTGVDSNGNPKYGALMKWSNPLAASRTDGLTKGFNFFDDINFQGHNILVNGAANKMKFTWVSWSDWGNYHNIALTNETSKSGIAMNNDNLVLFGGGKRADATTGWKA